MTLARVLVLCLVLPVTAPLTRTTSAATSPLDVHALVASESAPADGVVVSPLTQDELDVVFAEVVAEWSSIGQTPGVSEAVVTDLDGDLLGTTEIDVETSIVTIQIDVDAAGHGWGADGMDLATVVRHEVGHALGHDHTVDGLMSETLAVGVVHEVPGHESTTTTETTTTETTTTETTTTETTTTETTTTTVSPVDETVTTTTTVAPVDETVTTTTTVAPVDEVSTETTTTTVAPADETASTPDEAEPTVVPSRWSDDGTTATVVAGIGDTVLLDPTGVAIVDIDGNADPAPAGLPVVVTGTSGDDTIRIAGGDAPVPVTIDGGNGVDTLLGPATDATWSITGDSSGTVAGADFVGVERLEGAADNDDTFVLEADGWITSVHGGDGGFDSLVVNRTATTAAYAATGPDSGTVTLDGSSFTYAGLEPVSVGAADDYEFANTTAGATITISATGSESFEISGSAIETHDFSSTPTGTLTIKLGGGNETMILGAGVLALFEAAGAELVIDGEGGDDTLRLDDDIAGTWTIGDSNATSMINSGTWEEDSDDVLDFGRLGFGFVGVEFVEGANTADDKFDFATGGAVTGGVDGRGGNVTIAAAGFVQVDNQPLTALPAISVPASIPLAGTGTITPTTVLAITGQDGDGVTGLIGAEPLDDPVGLQGTYGDFALLIVTDGTSAWHVFQGTMNQASIVGPAGIDFEVGLLDGVSISVNDESGDAVPSVLDLSFDPTTGSDYFGLANGVEFNFATSLTRASITTTIEIDDYVFVTGVLSLGKATDTVDVATGWSDDFLTLYGGTIGGVFDDLGLGDLLSLPEIKVQGVDPIDTLTDVYFNSNYTVLHNVPVKITEISFTNASVFVGNNPGWVDSGDGSGGAADGILQEDELSDEAVGLFATGIDVAILMIKMKPTSLRFLNKKFPKMKAVHLDIDGGTNGLQFVGWDNLEFSASSVSVDINDGKPWTTSSALEVLAGPPVVDFSNDNYVVDLTSVGGGTVTFDFDGNQRFRATLDEGVLVVGQTDDSGTEIEGAGFVHVTGNFAIEKGPTAEIDIATRWKTETREALELLYGGASGAAAAIDDLASTLGITWDDDHDGDGNPDTAPLIVADKAEAAGSLAINDTFTTIYNLTASYLQIGASNVNVFVGYNPGWTDSNLDGKIQLGELDATTIGMLAEGVDFGMVQFDPLIPGIPEMSAMKLDVGTASLIGSEYFNLSMIGTQVVVNSGAKWPAALGNAPVVDFTNSFGFTGDGYFDVLTGGVDSLAEPVRIDYGPSALVGFRAEDVFMAIGRPGDGPDIDTDETLAEGDVFLSITGSFEYMQGEAETVTVATGLPANALDLLFDDPNDPNDAFDPTDPLVSGITSSINALLGKVTNGSTAVSADYTQITGLAVGVVRAGFADASVFLGYNPGFDASIVEVGGEYYFGGDTDRDGTISEAELSGDATGIFVSDVDFGMVQMTPFLKSVTGLSWIPSFRAFELTATTAKFVGLEEEFELELQGITVVLNDGDTWPGGFGPPVVDFQTSYTAEPQNCGGDIYVDGVDAGYSVANDTDGDGKACEPAGYEVPTGGGDSVYLAFDGNQRIGASVDHALIAISDFVTMSGQFEFEIGPTARVDVATRFPLEWRLALMAAAGVAADFDAALTTFGLDAFSGIPIVADKAAAGDGIAFKDDFTRIYNVEVATTQIGATGVNLFMGYNPGWDFTTDADKMLTIDELDEHAVGLFANGVSVGFGMFEPTIAAFPGLDAIVPSMWALKVEVDQAGFVGGDIFTAALAGVTIRVNSGDKWPGAKGPPVIDFQTSFPEEPQNCGVADYTYDVNDDPDGDNVPCELQGFQVKAAGTPIYLDEEGAAVIGFRAERALLSVHDFLHVTGAFSYEQGTSQTVTVATGLPGTTLDLLVNSPGNEIATAISSVAEALRNTLNAGLDAAATPTSISADWSAINDVLVGVTQYGFTNASAFLGYNPGFNSTLVLGTEPGNESEFFFADDDNENGRIDEDELGDDAIGLFVTGASFGMVQMTPALQSFAALDWLPTFTALQLDTELVSLVGVPGLTAEARGISLSVNTGTAWPLGLGPPVVDFVSSFPAESTACPRGTDGEILDTYVYDVADDADEDGIPCEPVGFEIDTGGDPIYLAFDGNERVRAVVDQVFLKIGRTRTEDGVEITDADGDLVTDDFVYLAGGFAFELGPVYRVDVATGLPDTVANAADLAFGGFFDSLTSPTKPADGSIAVSSDFVTIWNVEVGSFQFGASDVDLFIGYAPGGLDHGGDYVITKAEVEASGAVGFFAEDIDLGFALLTPTGTGLEAFDKKLPKFYAMKASGGSLSMVGVPGVTMEATGIALEVNNGTSWGGGLGPPVVIFDQSFAAEPQNCGGGVYLSGVDAGYSLADDTDGDGKACEPVGYEVLTGGDSIYLDFDGNQRIGGGANSVEIQLGEFVYLTGSIYFEYGPVQSVPMVDALVPTDDLANLGQDVLTDIFDVLGIDSSGMTAEEITDFLDDFLGMSEKEVSFLTIGGEDLTAFVGFGGPYWTLDDDVDGNGVPSVGDTFDEDAVGVSLENLDFGLALMTPTLDIDPMRYFALRATADRLALVGLDDDEGHPYVTVTAEGITVELNMSTPALAGISILPVVDFSDPAYEFFGQGLGNGLTIRTAPVCPDGCGVTLDMGSFLIKVEVELIEIDLVGVVTLWGSFALEIGPSLTVDVTPLGGGAPTTHTVSTMTFGMANVSGFVGWGGPYWTIDADAVANGGDGDGAFDESEASSSAAGFHLTDADLGLVVAVDTSFDTPGVWIAGDLSIAEFGLVGLEDFLAVTGTLGFAFNVGVTLPGTGGGAPSVSTINWSTYDADTDDPDNTLGFAVNTGDVDNPVVLDADGFLIHVFLAGALTVSDGSDPLARLEGVAFIELTESSFQMFAAGTLLIGPDISADDPVFDITAVGALVINDAGFAADLSLSMDVGNDDLGLAVSARLIINTTNSDQFVSLPEEIIDFLADSSAASDFLADVDDETGDEPVPTIDDATFGTLGGQLQGRLGKIVDNGGQAECVALDPGDTLADANCFNISGSAPSITVGDGETIGETAADARRDNVLAILAGGTPTSLEGPAPYIFVAVSGTFSFGDFADGTGVAAISLASNQFEILVDLEFTLGTAELGIDVRASGFVGIYSDGVDIDISVSIDAAISSVIEVDVTGQLQINTRESNDYFKLDLNGRVDIFGVISVSGGVIVEVSNTPGEVFWSVAIPRSRKLTGSFGPLTISAYGFFQSDGQFAFTVSASAQLGPDSFNVNGSGSVTIGVLKGVSGGGVQPDLEQYLPDPNFVWTALADATRDDEYFLFATVFIDANVSVAGADLLGASASGSLYGYIGPRGARATLNLEFCVTVIWEICKDFDVATVTIPATIFKQVPPNLAEMNPANYSGGTLANGTLVLNVGDRGTERNVEKTATAEHYTITELGGDATAGYTVMVSAFGRSEVFDGVHLIIGDFGGDDDSFVMYGPAGAAPDPDGGTIPGRGSNTPVAISGGADDDVLHYFGDGVAELNGDGGNDELIGGTAGDTLDGGSGNDRIDGRGGLDTMTGGIGDDEFFGTPVELAGETVDGEGGTGDVLYLVGGGSADDITVRVNASNQIELVDGVGNITTLVSIEDLGLYLGAGADDITLEGDLSVGGIDTLTVAISDYPFTRSDGTTDPTSPDTVTMRLTGLADAVTLTKGSDPQLPMVERPGATPAVDEFGNPTSATPPTVDTTTASWNYDVVINGRILGEDLLIIDALGGDDDVFVQGIGSDVELRMGTGDDDVHVGSTATSTSNTGGTLDAVDATLTVKGQGHTAGDLLDVDDSGDPDGESGTLTDHDITGFGMAGSIVYETVETLDVWLGTGADTANIRSTSSAVDLTTVHAGGGGDTVNVSGAAPDMTTGDIDAIAGELTIDGGTGSGDHADISDYGDTTGDSGTLYSDELTGFGPADINYRNFDSLQVDLGQGGDTLDVQSVMAGPTTVDTNGGADDVTINGVAVGSNLTLNTDAAEDIVTVVSISGTATINGTGDADRIIIDNIDATATVTVNGLGGDDYITVRNTAAGSTLTVNGDDGDDWIDIVAMSGTVHVNGNDDDDTIEVGSNAEENVSTPAQATVNTGGNLNGIQGALTIDGNDSQASDWLYLDETGETTGQTGQLTATTISGFGIGLTPITYLDIEHLFISTGSGGDTINVLSTNGPDATYASTTESTLATGLGDDTINVSSDAPTNAGDVNAVLGHLIVDGQGGGVDTLNVHDNADTAGNTGYLTGTDITGLGMGTTVGSAGITYANLEFLNIDTGAGGDTFTIYSTHAGQTTLDTFDGGDAVNIRTIAGHTLVDSGDGTDTITVGSNAAALAGTVDGINALLEIDGGTSSGDADHLIVDDTGDTDSNVGTLTATTVEGLGMTIGAAHALQPSDAAYFVTIANAFDGSFTLSVGGTPTTALAFDASAHDVRDALLAVLNAGGGTYDSTDIQVSRILHDLDLSFVITFLDDLGGTAGWDAGVVTVDGTDLIGLAEYGTATATLAASTTGRIRYGEIEELDVGLGTVADAFHIRATHTTTTELAGGPGDDVLLVETIDGTTNVFGESGDDSLVVNPLEGVPDAGNGILGNALDLDGQSGSDRYVVNVWNDRTSELSISDSGAPTDGNDRLTINGTSGNDTFLLRTGMIASLSDETDGVYAAAEKIFYDNTIDAGITVNTLDGNDLVVFDDNSSLTTVNGGSGDDTFQIGQLFGGDIGTTLVVDTVLTEVTWGQLSNGVSYNTTINGGSGNDVYNVYRNLAVLQLNGDSGDDTFVIRTFLGVDETTSIDAGDGRDLIDYIWNAPVSINGGPGFDTVVIIGTEADDEFVVTDDGVYGAGRYVAFIGVEQLDVDGAEGDDVFNVMSTAPGVVVRIFGGLGSDTINVGADANAVYGDDLQGHTGLIAHDVESTCDAAGGCVDGAWDGTAVDGVAAEIVDNESNAVIIVETDGSTVVGESVFATDSYWVSLNNAPSDTVYVTVAVPDRSPEDELFRSYSLEVSLDGVTWSDAVTLTFTSGDFGTAQQVWVKAHGDLGAEGLRSIALQHLVVSDDSTYDALPLNNVMVDVVDDEKVGLIRVESAAQTIVSEAGADDTFDVSLTRAPITTTTVTLVGDTQVCVSSTSDTDGDHGNCTVVLTFTSADWSTARTVTVSAAGDGDVESFHFGYVTTTVDSGDRFDGTIDSAAGTTFTITGDRQYTANELRGYLFRITDGTGAGQVWDLWGNAASTGTPGAYTTIVTILGDVEAAPAPGDTYFIEGYLAPVLDGVLAGDVLADGDPNDDVVTIGNLTTALPTADGGLSGATVRVFFSDDTTEFRTILTNTDTTITVDGNWDLTDATTFAILDLQGVSVPLLAALVADDDVYGVMITESGGGTNVAEGTTDTDLALEFDTYEVVLTRAPVAGETVTVTVTPVASETLNADRELREMQQLCVGATEADVDTTIDDPAGCGSITLTFDSTNWNVAQTVYLWAVDDDVEDGSLLQDFADSAQRVYLVQGPLIVDGGIDEKANREFSVPVLLPGERAEEPVQPEDDAFDAIEDRQVDTLNVHNEDSVSPDTGNLTDTRLTGLGMGPDQFVGGRFLDGGITYADLEELVIFLGHGADQFTIESTHGGTTVVHGGDGDDVFDVRTIAGHTNVRGDADDDTVHVGTTVPVLGGVLDDLDALLVVDGGTGIDAMVVDDTGEGDDNLGTLTQTTLTGLDMVGASLDDIYSLTVGADTVDVTFTITIPGRADVTLTLPTGFTAGELAAALQDAIFPILDDTVDPPITGCGLGGPDAATPELDTPCSRSVYVWAHDGDFLIGFQGELQGIEVGLGVEGVDGDGAPSQATDLDRGDGINYYGFGTDEELTILLGDGDDRFNVRGTLPHTMLHTGPGDDVVFVSDAADLAGLPAAIAASDGSLTDVHDAVLHGTVDVDDLTFHGSLDLIAGDLDIDTESGRNTLAVSDRADADADFATITDRSIVGMAAGDITYESTGGDLAGQGTWALESGAGDLGSGLFGRGITIHAGTGDDVISIESVLGGATAASALQLVITTLYANDGDDTVTISAPDVDEARLVVHGEDGDDEINAQDGTDAGGVVTVAGLALIVFGNDGDDDIKGGSNDDILVGDDGRVVLFDDGAGYDVVLGGKPAPIPANVEPGGSTLGANETDDGVFETVDVVFSRYEPDADETTDDDGDNDDTIRGGDGDDLVIGGIGADALDGESDRDVVVGDQAVFTRHDPGTSPTVRELSETGDGTLYGGVDAVHQVDPGMGPLAWTITLLDHAGDTAEHLWGDDVAAGGSESDWVFGQLGDDVLHGDGTLNAAGDGIGPNADITRDGDDHVEGNGGDDDIHGGLGQDTIIGGSSDLFGLVTASMRPDGADDIWGGNGDATDRNAPTAGHDRDADVILGDNGNVYRIVGGDGEFLSFEYVAGVIPRATELLDYSPIGEDWYLFVSSDASPSAPVWRAGTGSNIGGDDIVRAEDGDDIVHGATGDDTIFGDAGDDDLYGEAGEDWLSGGTGDDGIVGDDGRIFTTRNGLPEPLYGLSATDYGTDGLRLDTPGDLQVASVRPDGAMYKSVELDLAIDGETFTTFYVGSHDIAYGGWGDDFLHGGEGDDALSGAEAPDLVHADIPYWDDPFGFLDAVYGPDQFGDHIDGNEDSAGAECTDCRNVLQFAYTDPSEFRFYDELDPLARVMVDVDGMSVPFLLDVTDGTGAAGTPENNAAGGDGDDTIFGDGGNDWIVGGAGHDRMFGGWGNDLLNADDVLTTNGGANDTTDTSTDPSTSFADIAYGGAGRDVMIANTGADRLVDWVGEFNSYIVPFSPFGAFTISRMIAPALQQYLLDLAEASGADITRGGDADRNGEPYGELGMVVQQDEEWQDQTGAPDDPQPGNLQGRRDVLRDEEFADAATALSAFAPDSGDWSVVNGRYESVAVLDTDAVSIFYVDAFLPSFYEITATVSADKAKGGYKANAYLVFDYQGETDYKFAGIEIGTSKAQIGRRTPNGMEVLAQVNLSLTDNRNYDLVVQVNGQTVTLYVDGVAVVSHTFASPLVDPADPSLGVVDPLTDGLIGVGSYSSKMRLTEMGVQTLAPEITFSHTDDFDVAPLHPVSVGTWTIADARMIASGTALSLTSLDVAIWSIIEVETVVTTDGVAGLVFDSYGPDRFKFVVLDALTDRLLIGFFDAGEITIVASTSILVEDDAILGLRLDGTVASVSVGGTVVLSHGFFSLLNDGDFGLYNQSGNGSFDTLLMQTDDPDLVPALPLVSITDVTVSEADGQAVVTVTLSRPADADVTIAWATADGTADATDYATATGTVTVLAGQTSATLVIDLHDDGVEEPDEYLVVAITDVTGAFVADGSGRVTILNDDNSVTVDVIVSDGSAAESGADPAEFELRRDGDASGTLEVRVRWDGVAVRGVDYTVAATGGTLSADGRTVTFDPGSSTVTLTVTPLGDDIAEGVENLTMTIEAMAHYAIGSGSAGAAIQDDVALPTLSIGDEVVPEGNRKGWVTVTISLSAPSTETVTVRVRTYDGTARAGSDYDGYVGTVTFAAGQTTATLDVRILGDRTREADETFTVELSAPDGAVIADGVGQVTLVDDDGGRLITTSAGDGGVPLSAAELDVALAAAVVAWEVAGHRFDLSSTTVTVADLDHLVLAEYTDGRIVIDLDAAGWGWSVGDDVTGDRIDLVSVLTHELGHALGFDHADHGVMSGTLEPGQTSRLHDLVSGPAAAARPTSDGVAIDRLASGAMTTVESSVIARSTVAATATATAAETVVLAVHRPVGSVMQSGIVSMASVALPSVRTIGSAVLDPMARVRPATVDLVDPRGPVGTLLAAPTSRRPPVETMRTWLLATGLLFIVELAGRRRRRQG